MTPRLLSASLAIGLMMEPTMSHAGVCIRELAAEADRSIDTLASWADVYAGYQRFRNCDDGAVAEGYSDRIVTLLVNKWGKTGKLAHLSRLDPAFGWFVLSHVDGLASPDQIKAIVRNAKTRCPSGATKFCQRLVKAAKAATRD